jgi:chromosome segregation ATPase
MPAWVGHFETRQEAVLAARTEAAEADAAELSDVIAELRHEIEQLQTELVEVEAEVAQMATYTENVKEQWRLLSIMWDDQRDLLKAAEAEVARLQAVLADIAAMTDADDPQSYRSDDREGCLDAVYAKAKRSLDAAGG